MAADTSKALRQQVMYCVYVRQYSKEGTFEKVREDLTRIRDLGVDILWLLPIHPIGKACRKGALGSPYAIRDYRAVNEEYGTMQDFERLAGEVHRLGMRLMIDVVYNHTSPDSWLAQHHPEWFYHRADAFCGYHHIVLPPRFMKYDRSVFREFYGVIISPTPLLCK